MPDPLWSQSPLTRQAEAQRDLRDQQVARETRAEHRKLHRLWAQHQRTDRHTRRAMNHRQGGPFDASFPSTPYPEAPGPSSLNPDAGQNRAPHTLW